MQGSMYLFLKRRWEQDEEYLNNVLDYFRDMNYPIQLMIFPEGTNLDNYSQPRSNSYAQKNNLPLYKHVLHPRVRGFVHCIEKLRKATRKIDAVYDVTVGYDQDYCYQAPDFVTGNFPKEIHFNIKRYNISEMPLDNTKLEQWLCQRWSEKEDRLSKFYMNGKVQFCPPEEELVQDSNDKEESSVKKLMLFSLVFFALVIVTSFYLLCRFAYARWFMLLLICMYIIQGAIGFGMDKVQLWIHNRFKKNM